MTGDAKAPAVEVAEGRHATGVAARAGADLDELLAAYYCAFDKQTPRHVQASLLGAIAYFVLPFDFVPDMLPILGFTDDAAILATAIRMVASHITPEHREAARAALKRGIVAEEKS